DWHKLKFHCRKSDELSYYIMRFRLPIEVWRRSPCRSITVDGHEVPRLRSGGSAYRCSLASRALRYSAWNSGRFSHRNSVLLPIALPDSRRLLSSGRPPADPDGRNMQIPGGQREALGPPDMYVNI